MPFFNYNGHNTYYDICGNGPPLVLIAGLASDSQSWQTVIPLLSAHFTLILPDNRGAGRSTQTGISISIADMAEDCAALLKHLGLPAAHLVGHSMGGMVAMEWAARHPEQVCTLTLAATAPSISSRNRMLLNNLAEMLETGLKTELWLAQLFQWLFTDKFFENKTLVKIALQYAIDYPYPQSAEAFRNQIEAISAYDGRPVMKEINARTLLLHGRDDIMFNIQQVKIMLDIPDSRLIVIPDAAHSIHLEQPSVFSGQLLEFICPDIITTAACIKTSPCDVN